MTGMVKVICFAVHSEANTRRIRVVEQCFGSNGEVSDLIMVAMY